MATTHSNESIRLHRVRLYLQYLQALSSALLLLSAIRSSPPLLMTLSNHGGASDGVTAPSLRLRAKIDPYVDT